MTDADDPLAVAEAYIARQVEIQVNLGYARPSPEIIARAVDETANAITKLRIDAGLMIRSAGREAASQ